MIQKNFEEYQDSNQTSKQINNQASEIPVSEIRTDQN